MKLSVNGQAIDITLENEKTVGDILKSFESEMEKNDATTVKIVLDGKEIASTEFDSILGKELTDTTSIDFGVVSKIELVSSLHAISDTFSALSEKLETVPVLLQSGKDKEASGIIEELATACDSFCHIGTMTMLFPELYEKLTINGAKLEAFFKELLPILNDFEAALKDKDTVTLGDISEYEMVPRLHSIIDAIKAV
ncbi:MAG: hypothetical protein IJ828_09105 [Treponema sp.]|nr:hypothetical protein [Treponema sp.]